MQMNQHSTPQKIKPALNADIRLFHNTLRYDLIKRYQRAIAPLLGQVPILWADTILTYIFVSSNKIQKYETW